MAVGIVAPLPAYTVDAAFIAQKAEGLGFEFIWYHEHPILPVHSDTGFPATGGDIPETYRHLTDPYIALARASAVTDRIMLATGITLVPERNPLILAKEIAALDYYSGGRFLFGIGAGWNREETTIMGGDFDHRWAQTREAVLAMKELWTKDEAEFHGRYYDFPPVYCYPKPVQKPHPPVLLGGNAPNVLQRVARWGDGWLPTRVSPAQVEEGRNNPRHPGCGEGPGPGVIDHIGIRSTAGDGSRPDRSFPERRCGTGLGVGLALRDRSRDG